MRDGAVREARRYRAALVVVMACAGANAILFRHALLTKAIAPGEILRGSFESQDDGVVVALSPWSGAHMWPDDLLGLDGQVVVMPGRSVGVPLARGATYTITNPGGMLAPYVLFGRVEATGRQPLLESVTPTPDGPSGMRMAPWARDRPWREDEARLAELARACLDTDDTSARMSIQESTDGWSLHFGHCNAGLPTSGMGGVTPTLVGLGATDGLTIDRPNASVHVDRRVNVTIAVVVILAAATMVAGLGPLGALVASGSAAALGSYNAVAGLLVFCAVQVLGLTALVVRGARALPRRLRPAAAAIAFVLVAVTSARLLGIPERWRAPPQAPGHDRCSRRPVNEPL